MNKITEENYTHIMAENTNSILHSSDQPIGYVSCLSKYSKEVFERESRMISPDELLSYFSKDAEKKMLRSPLFNNIFQSLMAGANRYEIIEQLIDMVEKYQKDNEELMKYSAKPIYIKTE